MLNNEDPTPEIFDEVQRKVSCWPTFFVYPFWILEFHFLIQLKIWSHKLTIQLQIDASELAFYPLWGFHRWNRTFPIQQQTYRHCLFCVCAAIPLKKIIKKEIAWHCTKVDSSGGLVNYVELKEASENYSPKLKYLDWVNFKEMLNKNAYYFPRVL